MKTRILLSTLLVTSLIGCAAPNYRSGLQHRNARSIANCSLKGTQACPLANKKIAKRGERQSWGKDHKEFNNRSNGEGVRERFGEAVKSGKLTKEEAKERFAEWRNKEGSGHDKTHLRKGKKDGTKSRSTKNRQQ